MIVLGLDMSTCAGVSVLDSISGVVLHAEDVKFPKLTGMERINAIIARVVQIRDKYSASCAVIEDYAVGKFAGSSIVSIEIGGVLRFILWQEGFPFICVSPSSVKKFVTGAGNAKKDQMTLEVFKRFGYSASSNDIADAVGMAHLGAAIVGHGNYSVAQRQVALVAHKTYPTFRTLAFSFTPIYCS